MKQNTLSNRKIFLGAQEIAGMMERLNNAFHDMGIESDYYCLYQYKFALGTEEKKDSAILRKYRKYTDKIGQTTNKYIEEWWHFLQMGSVLHLFFHALFKYDFFIYIFGHGMFYFNKHLSRIEELEFFILKLFHKKMVMWLCGSDSRPPYCNGAIYFRKVERLHLEVQKRYERIRMLEKYMTLVDVPGSAHFHTKPYLIHNCIGIPVDAKEKVCVHKADKDKVTILHAPSNQKSKGTEIIRNILKEIREEGYEFEYIEVSGLPHDVVLEKMAMSDIVIDQLYSDTPMAGFATEASINGVPVVVGGYYAEVYKKVLPQPIAPTVYCSPEEMKEKIIYLIEHKEERDRIGKEEQEYIENNCLATVVADKFLKIFDGSYPKEWVMDPADNDYIWGCGTNKELVTHEIVRLVDAYGPDSLCLDKNGILYQKYMQLYHEAKSEKEGLREER